MSKDILNIREEIRQAKMGVGLLQRLPCSKEDNKLYRQMLHEGHTLPEGIFKYETPRGTELDEFYLLYDPQLTEKEQKEYIALMQYKELKTIRKCVFFFTVLAIIALVIGFILGIALAQ